MVLKGLVLVMHNTWLTKWSVCYCGTFIGTFWYYDEWQMVLDQSPL